MLCVFLLLSPRVSRSALIFAFLLGSSLCHIPIANRAHLHTRYEFHCHTRYMCICALRPLTRLETLSYYRRKSRSSFHSIRVALILTLNTSFTTRIAPSHSSSPHALRLLTRFEIRCAFLDSSSLYSVCESHSLSNRVLCLHTSYEYHCTNRAISLKLPRFLTRFELSCALLDSISLHFRRGSRSFTNCAMRLHTRY